MRWTMMLLIASFVSGCATGNFCDVANPIRPSANDNQTPETKRQILTHNAIGAELCGWRP